jgi:CDP-6-deoxy-D-xylo-4-hexulose-3-dehydrase
MIPSLMGNIPNLQKLQALAKKRKLWLIEDSCDTLGGKFKNRPTGVYSDISTTSFYGSHVINGAGGGGMICVNNPKWAERLVVLRGWGRRSSLFGEKADSEQLKNRFRTRLAGVPYDEKFTFSEIGYNFLPLEISAAFALVQLKKFPRFEKLRRRHFTSLYAFFSQYKKYFILPKQTKNTKTAWLAFPLIIKDSAPFIRMEIVQFLEEHNIQTRPVFTGNILKQPGFKKISYRPAQKKYPHTDLIMKNAFVVGCHHGLSGTQIEYLQARFTQFLNRYF